MPIGIDTCLLAVQFSFKSFMIFVQRSSAAPSLESMVAAVDRREVSVVAAFGSSLDFAFSQLENITFAASIVAVFSETVC